VEAVRLALRLLDCFQSRAALGLPELAAEAGLTRNRTTRLVGTLESGGYLRFDPDAGQYRLGSRLLTLGKAYEAHTSLIALARPLLRELVEATGEMASLYVLDGLERVVLAREQGTQPIGYNLIEGERLALHAGAAGKILLAYAPPEVPRAVLRTGTLPQFTPRTILDPVQLVRELTAIRRQGYAFSRGERAPDAASIAAPVFDYRAQACAALGIAGPANRFTERLRRRYARLVVEKARALSERLGWTDRFTEGGEP